MCQHIHISTNSSCVKKRFMHEDIIHVSHDNSFVRSLMYLEAVPVSRDNCVSWGSSCVKRYLYILRQFLCQEIFHLSSYSSCTLCMGFMVNGPLPMMIM